MYEAFSKLKPHYSGFIAMWVLSNKQVGFGLQFGHSVSRFAVIDLANISNCVYTKLHQPLSSFGSFSLQSNF